MTAADKVFRMDFAKVYPLLIQKAVRKGRTREEVDTVASWLTGYTPDDLERILQTGMPYGEFFLQAPALNPDRKRITGVICGIRVEDIEDPLMQEIRYLDQLVDELAQGKPLAKILRSAT